MSRRTDIVVTTIFEPFWLEGYLTNLRAHGRSDEVTIRIICDRKTPSTVFEAADAARRDGFDVDCPSLEEQAAYLAAIGAPDDFVPWNTDNRRNIGFLRAWEQGADVLISIDDDNYCVSDEDFVGAHHVVGTDAAALSDTHGTTDAPWFNICSLLEVDAGIDVYPRGFPYHARREDALSSARGTASGTVAVNAGLWVGDPDVDAITRLTVRPIADRTRGTAVVLGPDTWSPVNTQNTGLLRDAIPAYYYVRMGFPLQGMKIDRFGDILSGYFVQKCAKHLGYGTRLGSPVLEHRRTEHNLLADLHQELAGVALLEDLLPWLQEVQLSGGDFQSAYADLAARLREVAPTVNGFVWDEGGREFLVETARLMETWLTLVETIGGG